MRSLHSAGICYGNFKVFLSILDFKVKRLILKPTVQFKEENVGICYMVYKGNQSINLVTLVDQSAFVFLIYILTYVYLLTYTQRKQERSF